MCDLVSAGIAATALGGAVSAWESNKYQKGVSSAYDAATKAEIDRQRQFQSQASATFGGALNSVAGTQGAEKDAAKTRNDYSQSLLAGGSAGAVPMLDSTGGDVRAVMDKEQRAAGEFSADKAGLAANLAGRGDVSLSNAINLNRSAGQLGEINSAARGSARLLPGEQQAAVAGVSQPLGIGQILGSAGSLAASAGFSGVGPGIFGKVAAAAPTGGVAGNPSKQPVKTFIKSSTGK